MNFAWNARIPRSIQASFTCRKSTTCDRRLYFPSEGRCAKDFFALKNPTASAGFEPANLGTKGQHDTSIPPKPLSSVPTPDLIGTDPEMKAAVRNLYEYEENRIPKPGLHSDGRRK